MTKESTAVTKHAKIVVEMFAKSSAKLELKLYSPPPKVYSAPPTTGKKILSDFQL